MIPLAYMNVLFISSEFLYFLERICFPRAYWSRELERLLRGQ